jgi:hypothetical protein
MHTMRALSPLVFLATTLSCSQVFGQTTYELVLKGKSCTEQKSQQVDCNYKIGTHFWLSIAAVGSSDAGITFMKSDFNGKYYATVGVAHGCVVVKTGVANTTSHPLDLAFVSPRNGKVYQDWQSCQAAN